MAESEKTELLVDGYYPFADTRLPLSEMAMIEAPLELETLLHQAARDSGVLIIRDRPVELVCQSAEYPDATFLVYWPSGSARLNILAPAEFAKNRA